jgi:hypothetical protein
MCLTAARNVLAVDILLDNRVALPIDFFVGGHFAVIGVGARRNSPLQDGKSCAAGPEGVWAPAAEN